MGAGRPIKFTEKELKNKVDQYIEETEKPTLAGLAYFLEIDRQTLYNYAEKDQFFDIIKKARNFIEARYEQELVYSANPTGKIFALKNMGWQDKSEVESSGSIGIIWNEQKTYE